MRYYPCDHPRGPSLGYLPPRTPLWIRLKRALIRWLP
jgi:hypothetical protein